VNIIICLKQVLNPAEAEIYMEGKDVLNQFIVNPPDRLALEIGLRMRNSLEGSRVIALTAGPERAREALVLALARGCDKAVHLQDNAFETSDGYSTALAISKTVELLGFDLILCGDRSLDTNAGYVSPALASLLDIPLVTRVITLEQVTERVVRVLRRLERGKRQLVECDLPALLSMDPLAGEPRYAPLFALQEAAEKDIRTLSLRDVGLSQNSIGREGSLVRVEKLMPPRPRSKPVTVPDSGSSLSQRLSGLFSGGIPSGKQKELLKGAPEYLVDRIVAYLKKEDLLPEPD
jgi:electron transfer flavoprotein beta subunit